MIDWMRARQVDQVQPQGYRSLDNKQRGRWLRSVCRNHWYYEMSTGVSFLFRSASARTSSGLRSFLPTTHNPVGTILVSESLWAYTGAKPALRSTVAALTS